MIDLAKQIFDAAPGSDHEYDPDFDMGDEWQDSSALNYLDVVPFAAALAHAFTERYQAIR